MPTLMEWLRQRVYSFEKANPHIKVVQSQKSWNMIREILYADFSAGAGPDIVNVHANYAPEFGEAGALLSTQQVSRLRTGTAVVCSSLS